MFDGGRSTVAASFRRLNDNRARKFASLTMSYLRIIVWLPKRLGAACHDALLIRFGAPPTTRCRWSAGRRSVSVAGFATPSHEARAPRDGLRNPILATGRTSR